jgi:hypothetical protein
MEGPFSTQSIPKFPNALKPLPRFDDILIWNLNDLPKMDASLLDDNRAKA